MNSRKKEGHYAVELRRRAEDINRDNFIQIPENLENLSRDASHHILQELRVHQIELEMQNEVLRRTQEALEFSRMQYFTLFDQAPVGYLTLSENGLIVEANLAIATLLGVEEKHLVRQPLTGFIFPEDQVIYDLYFRQLLSTVTPQVCELRLSNHSGEQFWVRMEAAMAGDAAEATLCHVVVSDITERKHREEERIELETHFNQLFENMSSGVIIYETKDEGKEFVFKTVNRAVEKMESIRKEDVIGKSVLEIFPGIVEFGLFEVIRRVWRTGKPEQHPVSLYHDERISGWKKNYVYKLANGDIVTIYDDMTQHKRVENALASSESQLRTLVETIPDLIWLKSADGVYMTCNRMFESFFGAKEAEIVGKTDYDFVDKELADFFRENDRKAMAVGKPSVNEEWLTFANDGHKAWVETIKTPMVDAGGTLVGVLGISRDITERMQREQVKYYQATHDELTGLYNRRGFAEVLAKKLSAGAGGALLLVGIDDFKLINDVYGLGVGDQYLAAFGGYLHENFGDALLARFGGDEFMLFFEGSDGLLKAARSSDRMGMEVVLLEIEAGSFFVQLSGGIALLTEPEYNLDLQVQQAYLALHHAKDSGKRCCKTYESAMQDKVSRHYAIRDALNHAIVNEEFHLVFQPIFNIQETPAKIVGYEALLRWTSRQLGEVSPGEFISVAEETNLILPIGKWVLRKACLFSANIGKTQGEFVNVAVNISMLQLAMPSFVTMVKETLQETGLPACNLSLEVTESILMADAVTRISYLQELRDFGVSISLDDFGTGYSSFTYLSQMPITTLKIDKSMVDEVPDGSSKSLRLMESLLQLSTLLGYKVVAEGVEKQEQLDFLKNKGCVYVQGYLLGRPMEETAVLAMVGERQRSREGAL